MTQTRSFLDFAARRYKVWEDDQLVVDEPLTSEQTAELAQIEQAQTRETRYATLLDRAEAAQQGNRDSRATLADIAGAASFNNTQRDQALRFLAGRVDALTVQNNALMQLVLRLAGRVAAMDAPD